MSLRILVVTNMYPTPDEPSFGIFVRDQVADLQELGDHVEVLSFDGRRRASAYASAVRELRRRVRGGRFDVIHAHYGLSGAVAVTQRAVPVAITFHGSDTNIVWQRVVSTIVARFATVIAVEKSALARLRVKGTVIACGVDLDLFQVGDRESARERLGWPSKVPIVILPGARSNVRKGADLFDATLRLVRGKEPTVEGRSLEGFDRVGVRDALTASDVLLMTSQSEGSPVAVKEALACGTPVVSVDVGDVRTVLSGLADCRVCERQPAELARSVSDAFSAPDRAALRTRAETYGRRAIAGLLHETLAAAAAGRSSAG